MLTNIEQEAAITTYIMQVVTVIPIVALVGWLLDEYYTKVFDIPAGRWYRTLVRLGMFPIFFMYYLVKEGVYGILYTIGLAIELATEASFKLDDKE